MKWAENHEVSGSNPSETKILGDFFLFVIALVGRGRYLMEIS